MLEAAVDRVIQTEGGYVHHPADSGGPTKHGITLRTLELHRGERLTAEHVMELPIHEARTIYLTNYWMRPGFASLGLHKVPGEMLFDAAVNHGPTRAIKLLQSALGVLEDGIIGDHTRGRVKQADTLSLAALFMAERVRFYGQIITQDPSQAVFAAGWMARSAGFIEDIPRAQF